MKKDIRILIVEDEPLIAEDIAGFLQTEGYSNTTSVYDSAQAIAQLDEGKIEFVLLDINLETGLTGIQLAQLINKDYLLPFVFITSYSDSKTINEVKETHPVGFILKPFSGKEIAPVLEIGYELFYTYMGGANDFELGMLNKYASEELTPKEIEVMQKIAEGKTNKEIADALFVSVNTIKTHLKNIFVKLNIASRAEAMLILNRTKITR
ncbi:MAG TPA: response regulator transcription factor [Flavobacteriales bacterium]|nr:response regulator transcription factor [Flavobacteriales bacterium]